MWVDEHGLRRVILVRVKLRLGGVDVDVNVHVFTTVRVFRLLILRAVIAIGVGLLLPLTFCTVSMLLLHRRSILIFISPLTLGPGPLSELKPLVLLR